MATTTERRPLSRSQDEIVERLRMRLLDTSDEELRHITLAEALDRAHAAEVIADDDPNRDSLLAGYPEQAPTRDDLIKGLIGQSLPSLLRQVRAARTSTDMLAEQAWLLGRDDVARAMVPDDHAPVGHVGLLALVRFCRGFKVPLPGEGTDEFPNDLAAAAAAVDAEQDTDGTS